MPLAALWVAMSVGKGLYWMEWGGESHPNSSPAADRPAFSGFGSTYRETTVVLTQSHVVVHVVI